MADPAITARLKLDTSGYQKGVNQVKGSTSSFTRIRDVMAGVFGGNLLTAAAQKTKDFFVGAVQGAMNAERAQTEFKTALQNTVGATDQQVAAADKFLTAQSKNAAVAKSELRPAYETLLRGTHSLTGAQDALSTALDVSAGTGKPLSAVAQAITKGFLGSTGGLQRMGIATKDASGHALSMTQIMANLNKQFGGQAAKQADTTAGRYKNLQIQFKAFQVTIGQALLPVLTQLMGVFLQLLGPLQAVGSFAKTNPGLFKLLAAAILVVVVAVKAWQIAQAIAAAATGIWAAVNAVLGASFWAALGPVLLIIAAIALLAAGVIYAYTHFSWFKTIVDTVWAAIQVAFNAIVAAASWLVSFFASNWQLLLTLIGGPIGLAVVLVITYWDQLKAAAGVVVNFIIAVWNFLQPAFAVIAAAIGLYIQAIVAVWNVLVAAARVVIAIISAVWRGLQPVFAFIGAVIRGYINMYIAIFNALRGPVMAVVNFMRAAWNGFTAFLGGVVGVVRGIAGAIGNAFGIVASIVGNIIGGVRATIQGFVSFISGVVNTVTGIGGRIVAGLKRPINALIGLWNRMAIQIPQVSLPDINFGPIHIKGPTIGGQRFDFPDIPLLQRGGRIYSEGLAYLHAGELVTPAAQVAPAAAGPAVVIHDAHFGEAVDVDLFMRRVAWQLQTSRI